MRLGRSFGLGRGTLVFGLDGFNLRNNNAVVREVETISPTLGRPSAILAPRTLRVGLWLNV